MASRFSCSWNVFVRPMATNLGTPLQASRSSCSWIRIWILAYKKRARDIMINRRLIVVAILLLILSTGVSAFCFLASVGLLYCLLLTFCKHIVAKIVRIYDGLVMYRDTYPGGPVAFFADPTQTTLAIMHAFLRLTNSTG
ncbi:hypothetical protein DEU56DRAFT_261110 [Suillus clintonianus]|uniref:uncharacterized protein n=1 Tax=Suillus clintonianus TaxID=1904413 RepID=UPI001B86B99A|nr:uncharacterized protein DEU56DRAFT_261110 [Suillus clintonianus]KAG2142394.1 hypothetical protein DEU56DRAFT_261110 [Suillus clintonianus]